ncbi:MAG: hypothetical protein K9I69_09210 [Ignavibacteriales bacterium]|nr:hypothetical protein [Ignavibacteriales bacterium]MCF8435210.1 hypothetical protein [Ignavibacteriales bacterium]
MKRIYHVISNTHWDREWRFPFQRNRQMLVNMIDETIRILENNKDYRAFHLDSQTVVLRDYLEIKPQNAEKIKGLVESDRLLIGPWYILPEEYQVGGENLIRNLLLGHKIAKKFGKVSKIGYSPFSWGQISQLPQIYSGFGIDVIMFYRGINSIDSPKAEFLWVGADGTETISSRFSTMPRYNFYFYIYRPVRYNEDYYQSEYKWEHDRIPFHFADDLQGKEDYFLLEEEPGYYPENIRPWVEKIIKDQADDFTTQNVIWMEGHDSSGPDEMTVRIINDIRKEFPELDVRHSTLLEYATALKSDINTGSLVKVHGERRSAQFDRRSGNLYGYTTSARMDLKILNFDAERNLQYYAEPFNGLMTALGCDTQDKYVELAWDLLIQNSAHDSIGGCSLDEIHDDMITRYRHCIEISRGVFERSIKMLILMTNSIKILGVNKGSFILTVINSLFYTRKEVCRISVDVPKSMDKGHIKIFDYTGAEINISIQSKTDIQPVLEQMKNRPMYIDMVRYIIDAELDGIPSMGYKQFRVEPVEDNRLTNNTDIRVRKSNILENDFLRVEILGNGSFNVSSKMTGKTFSGLGFFADEGEAGHAWVHTPIGPFIDSKNVNAEIVNLVSNELVQCSRIIFSILVPEDLKSRGEGLGNSREIKIEYTLSLRKTDKYLVMEGHIENNAESHRMRIMFPLNLSASHSFAEGQFDVVARSTKRIDSTGWIEQPMYDYPMHHFVDLSDSKDGFAVLVDGLKEYEVLNDEEQTLAITVFRGFEYKIQPSSLEDYSYKKGSQNLGKNHFRIGLFPHKGTWSEGRVMEQAHIFNYPLRAVQSGITKGFLPSEISFIWFSSQEIVFSTIKKPEQSSGNNLVIRIYNPTENEISTTLDSILPIESITEINLEETESHSEIIEKKGSYILFLKPKQIKTYLMKINSIL